MRRRRGIMGLNGGASTPVITATATGNPLSFITDMVRPLKSLEIPFTPIQSGSGDPSPDNVRPISGWTGANIAAMAKNMFNPQANTAEPTSTTPKRYAPGYIYPGMHATAPNTNWWATAISGFAATATGFKFTRTAANNSCGVGYVFRANPGDRLTRSATFTNASFSGWRFYDSSMSRISTVNTDTATVPAGTFYGFLTVLATAQNTEAEISNYIICNGEAPITFEPYAGTTLPINWQDEAGTIYGGTLTLNEDGSADLFISHKAMNLGSLSWRKETTGSPTHTFRTNSTCENYGIAVFASGNGNVCSCFVAQTSQTGNINLSQWRNETSYNNYIGTGGAWPNAFIYAKPVGITTLEAFRALIQDQILVCKLATSATYHFNNVGQLITFVGTNTIWTDTNGTNTATYLKH